MSCGQFGTTLLVFGKTRDFYLVLKWGRKLFFLLKS